MSSDYSDEEQGMSEDELAAHKDQKLSSNDQLMLQILNKLDLMQENYKSDLEMMMERYMSKLSFLEKEIMSLSISVSYLRKVANKKELNASLPVLDVTTGISEQDDEYYQEEIEEAVYQYESQASQPAPDFIVQEVEAVETQDETQDGQYETEVEMLFETPEITQNESLNEDVLIISPKKKRSRRASDVQLEETQEPKLMKCTSMLNLLPLNNEDDLQMLDDYLISNEDETIKFVAYLKKAKFDKGLKSAFFSLMTANMLLEFNYNGKGQMKRALNKYRIFKTIIFDAFCNSPEEISGTLSDIKKIIRNSHNNFNKCKRLGTRTVRT